MQNSSQQQSKQPTEGKSSFNKQIDFYNRARKEYENGDKPFSYELNLFSTQPKPKKFMIILNRFVEIFKEGMKWEYRDDDETKDNYWNELEKHYSDIHYELAYLTDNSYEKKKNKLRLYFGLLLSSKKLFQFLKEVPQKLPYLYEDPKKKIQQLDQQLQLVSFLKDGQYIIMSDLVTEFSKYQEEKKRQEKLKQKALEAEKKRQQEMQEARRKKQEQQKRQREKKEQQERQRIERERKQLELRRKQQQKAKSVPIEKTPDTMDDSIGFIPETYRTQNSHQRTNQMMKRREQSKKQHQELPQWNVTKGKHQKNSEILFQEKYKDEFEVFCFRLKPEMESSQEKKQLCYECHKPLKQGFYFIGGNQNQCYYTGEWFCNQHMAEQRISIPWKALESFDLRGYPVSRKSYIEIKSYYEKPIIEIKNDAQVVKQSKILYDFLVLKRQIHLMYDSICDLQLMEPLLRKKLNYCLKQNLFSLKNLYDIYNGHQGPSLQKQYDILSKHFYRCERCQKRKGYVCPKCKEAVKIFAFELKQTHGCTHCRKLYHRKCLPGGKCDCQDDD